MPASAAASDGGAGSEKNVPPVVDATPNGDVAGVGNPSDVAEIDGHVEAQTSEAASQAVDPASTGDVAGLSDSPARHEQGELTFDDEAEPTTKPKNERGGTAV